MFDWFGFDKTSKSSLNLKYLPKQSSWIQKSQKGHTRILHFTNSKWVFFAYLKYIGAKDKYIFKVKFVLSEHKFVKNLPFWASFWFASVFSKISTILQQTNVKIIKYLVLVFELIPSHNH